MKILIVAATTFMALSGIAGSIFALLTTTLGAPIPLSALAISTAAAALVIIGIRTFLKAGDLSQARSTPFRRRRVVLKCLIIDESRTQSQEVMDAAILQ